MEQVDGGVEEGGLEFGFGVGIEAVVFGLFLLDPLGDVDERDDVQGELAEDRADDVRIEDVGLGAFFRQLFDGLWGVRVSDCCQRRK